MGDPIGKEKEGRQNQAIQKWLDFLCKGYKALTMTN